MAKTVHGGRMGSGRLTFVFYLVKGMRLIMCYPHDFHLPLLGEWEGDNEKKVFNCLREKSLIRSQ